MLRCFWSLVLAVACLSGFGGPARAFQEDAQQQVTALEKTISIKEQELKSMRLQVLNLRRTLEANQQTNTRFFNNSIDLVEDMPQSAFPKAGTEFAMERAAAKKWFEGNFPGRNLQLYAHLYDLAVEGTGPYSVTVYFRSNNIYYLPKNGKNMQFDRLILFDNQPCAVMLSGVPGESFLSFSSVDKEGSWIARYDNCTAEEVEHLRGLKNYMVNLRGKILYAMFQEKDVAEDTMGVVVSVSPMTIDDFLPKHTKKEATRLEAQILAPKKD